MKAVALVGGKGTRLRPLTYASTKALLPIVNVPFMDRLVRRLERAGASDLRLALNHRATELEEHFQGRHRQHDVSVTCCVEPAPLGSGGALRFNGDFLDDTFLLVNGDVLTDLDYAEALRFHKEKGGLVTVCIAQVEDPTRFGVIDADDDGRVVCWQEKPSLAEARSNWVNIGIWVMEPSLISHIPDGRFVSLEKDIFPKLLEQGAPFYAFKSGAYWADIGTAESYAQIHWDILRGAVQEPIAGQAHQEGELWIGQDCEVPADASLTGPAVIGEQTRVGRNAAVHGPAVVGAGCEFGRGTSIRGSILWDRVVVGERAVIENSILGNNVRIASGSRIVDTVIADDSSIDVPLLQQARLGPGTVLTPNSVSAAEDDHR